MEELKKCPFCGRTPNVCSNIEEHDHIAHLVLEQPTAYDVDKVVERLEEIRDEEYVAYKDAKYHVEDEKHRYAYRLVGDIEEIVKRGGVNEQSIADSF